mmetsp:Transcript_1195/g.3554  ORF Transcript_1195/g.3554 Transcript_1195/m.3554 type:complete len:175 (+) Transcript_1195:128-652(+)
MPPNMSHLRDAARADTEAARQPDRVPRWGIRKARAVPAPPPTGPHRRAPGSRAPSAQAGAAGPMQTARLASMPPPHFRALPPSGFGATAAGSSPPLLAAAAAAEPTVGLLGVGVCARGSGRPPKKSTSTTAARRAPPPAAPAPSAAARASHAVLRSEEMYAESSPTRRAASALV